MTKEMVRVRRHGYEEVPYLMLLPVPDRFSRYGSRVVLIDGQVKKTCLVVVALDAFLFCLWQR